MKNRTNPWNEISLDDYENHMRLESVKQLQTMNEMIKSQLETYNTETAMIFGIAGGNGLEYVSREKYRTVYGVDINEKYLQKVAERYSDLSGVLECLNIDLINESDKLPHAQLVIADLLIEYIGYSAFQKAILHVAPEYVSCVIQINTDKEDWVSDSPYLHSFDGLDEIHLQMDEYELVSAMEKIDYSLIFKASVPLPNRKAFLRLDFKNN